MGQNGGQNAWKTHVLASPRVVPNHWGLDPFRTTQFGPVSGPAAAQVHPRTGQFRCSGGRTGSKLGQGGLERHVRASQGVWKRFQKRSVLTHCEPQALGRGGGGGTVDQGGPQRPPAGTCASVDKSPAETAVLLPDCCCARGWCSPAALLLHPASAIRA